MAFLNPSLAISGPPERRAQIAEFLCKIQCHASSLKNRRKVCRKLTWKTHAHDVHIDGLRVTKNPRKKK